MFTHIGYIYVCCICGDGPAYERILLLSKRRERVSLFQKHVKFVLRVHCGNIADTGPAVIFFSIPFQSLLKFRWFGNF